MIQSLPHPSTYERDKTITRAYCDLCGASERTETDLTDTHAIGWSPDENRVAETHLSCLQGLWWRRDGLAGRVKRVEFHVCPTCFMHKLVPWFRSQGVSPSVWRHDSDDEP